MPDSSNEFLVKVEDLLDKIDKMWRDDSTQDDVAEEADKLRSWMKEHKVHA